MLSGLTIRGRCLLAAGLAAAVCAVVLDERDLLRVAVFVITLPLLASWLSARTRFGLRAERELLPDQVSVDSTATVRLLVHHDGRFPVGGMRLEDGVPYALGARPRFALDHSPARGGTILEYPIHPALRGIHHIGPLRTRVSDPFGLSEFERELSGHDRLVAVPRVVPMRGLPAGSGLGGGEEGTQYLQAGHGEDDTMVRQYRHGDEMRRVHWKSTAHRDELMVRNEEQPHHGGVTVLVDHRGSAHRGTGARSSLEWAISAAASIHAHLRHHGRHARLVTQVGHCLSGDSGMTRGDDSTTLEALAALQPSPQRELVCDSDPGVGRELIAVLGATTTAGVTELTKVRPPGARSLALLLDVRAWNGDAADGGFRPEVTAHRLRAAGWSVVTVDGPDTPAAAVWERLCRQSGSAVMID
ncbi:uncharacterized protein (DUF58 family) [Saccharopolyspora lacisalsi]|uniref:Uncharacterized protein (DUF58 family) n=1 Tax=Halosaccharopolyspora lacisalsi TaxID=1000566 RepID=A0A839DVH4_9PSEU|nr:DUF58 domain-containing protein [Halosaccharopolyspora lacisalsi]MBA8823407.1 uncharacterized protein (DUF58 family) [Halosaccharopolyspora lacisalsi]